MKLSFTSTVSLLTLILLLGFAYAYLNKANDHPTQGIGSGTTTEPYACPSDAKICPDGTAVGRTGPACEFVECPLYIPPTEGTNQETAMVVQGRVTISPTCPVMRNPPQPGCEPKGYATTITAYALDGKPTGASSQSAADGAFTLTLKPGTYVIRATGGAVYPRCEDVTMTLKADSSSPIEISCDSGIR